MLQDDPTAVCLPNGLSRQILFSPYSQHLIQAPGKLVILYEYMRFFQMIPTDGRPHDQDLESTWTRPANFANLQNSITGASFSAT